MIAVHTSIPECFAPAVCVVQESEVVWLGQRRVVDAAGIHQTQAQARDSRAVSAQLPEGEIGAVHFGVANGLDG
jgi:hypothetical protein